MSDAQKTTDPDGGEAAAKEAYSIYRGMKPDVRNTPHWDDLTNDMRGLLTWIARFSRHST